VRCAPVLGIAAALLVGAAPARGQKSAPEGAQGIEAAALEAQARARRPPIPSQRSSMVNANEARRRLAQAELKRSLGAEPLPGEFTRTPRGLAVNYRYWQRQEKLRMEVDQAQRRVNVTVRRLQPRAAVATLN
jgi:hypothetical protein